MIGRIIYFCALINHSIYKDIKNMNVSFSIIIISNITTTYIVNTICATLRMCVLAHLLSVILYILSNYTCAVPEYGETLTVSECLLYGKVRTVCV